MAPVKVYVELGGNRKELRELVRRGLIEIVTFPYEGRSRKLPNQATPSKVTADSTYVTCDSDISIGETVESEKWNDIRRVVGGHNEFDIRHIDSAYKSRCQFFLTRDKGDVLKNRNALQELLGIIFLHPDDDWQQLLAYVDQPGTP